MKRYGSWFSKLLRKKLKGVNMQDIFIWPDDSWVYREDYSWEEYKFLGDDFRVVPEGTSEWQAIVNGAEF